MQTDYSWQIQYILPNIILEESFENEFVAIVPCNDHRVKDIINKLYKRIYA